MKTAISMPDELFSRAETFAKRHRLTRSALVSRAVDEFLHRNQGSDITARLNEVYAKSDSSLDPALQRMQFASLPREEW